VESVHIAKVRAALPEALVDLGTSDRELAAVTGVSRPTISKIRRGQNVRPDLLVKVAAALLVFELHAGPTPEPSIEQELRNQLPLWNAVA
jgi:transcriptional regulator with XRE-family HTH domain